MKNLNFKYQPLTKEFRQLLVGIFMVIVPFFGYAQSRVISGTVRDANKIGLSGVTVMIKGSKTGTDTNFDGKYKITASENDQLVFSYIGFETKTMSVGSASNIDVTMYEATSKLNEVVIVGYGTQKKTNLTGAVSTVSAKQIENRPVTNVANALQGAVPGMNVTRTNGQPGNEGLAIQIRGASSANGNVNPLLVVDGVTTDLNVLQSINPNDVETISVLKDGSAAAIYGAQAAGGVILVTTKKGKQGKTIFEYNGQMAIQNPLVTPERVTLMEEALYSNAAFTNAGSPVQYSAFDLDNIKNNIPYVVDPANPNNYLFYNQEDLSKKVIGENDVVTTHNLSARGGTEKYNYMFSVGYMDQKGMMLVGADHYKRLNLRLNVGTELNKYLFLDSRIAYTKSETNRAAGFSTRLGEEYTAGNNSILFGIYKIRMRQPIYTPEGRYNGFGTTNNSYVLLKEGGYNNQYVDDMDANFQLTIKDVVKGLKFRTIYGHKQKTSEINAFFRSIELWNKTAVASILNNPNAYFVIPATLSTNNFQFLADYNLKLGEHHNFTALAGYQWEDFRNSQVDSRAFTLKSNDFPSLNIGEASTKQNSQSIQTSAMQSFFGRVSYSFKDKYIADFTIRTDENSRLAPENRKKSFPSASVGWNMHKEDWFSNNISFVSELKARASWGTLGNANGIGYYDYLALINNQNNLVLGDPAGRTSYNYVSTMPSADLSWETVETFNYGIDLGFFNQRLTTSFDYYTKENKNMLVPFRVPATFGVGLGKVNNGTLETKGWELVVNYKDKIGKDFSYGIGFNLSNSENEVKSYAGVSTIAAGMNTIIEGYPLNTIWGYATKPGYINNASELAAAPFYSQKTGIGDIAYVDQNGDGKINVGKGTKEDHGDLVMLGKDQQEYLFGVNLNAAYKNIDFSMFIQGVGKRDFQPNLEMMQPFSQPWISPARNQMDYWTPDHTAAAFPRPFLTADQNYNSSDRWTLDGAYARLKNIQLGYSLPADVTSKIFFTKVRLFVSGENLFTVSKLGIWDTTFDPEQRNGTFADYPMMRAFALGVNLSF